MDVLNAFLCENTNVSDVLNASLCENTNVVTQEIVSGCNFRVGLGFVTINQPDMIKLVQLGIMDFSSIVLSVSGISDVSL